MFVFPGVAYMLIHFTTFCVFMIFSSAWMILYTLPETSQPTAMKPPLKIPRANAPKRKLHLPPNPRKFQVQPTLGMEKTNSWDGKKTFPWFTSNPAPVFNRHRTFKNPTPFPKGKNHLNPNLPWLLGSSCQFSGVSCPLPILQWQYQGTSPDERFLRSGRHISSSTTSFF